SPDGRILAARSGQIGALYLLETATGKLLREFKYRNGKGGHQTSLNFAFSPDGKAIAAQLDDRLELRDVATGRILWQQKEQDIVGLAFSSDGKLLASAGGSDGVRLWDARTGEPLRALGPKEGTHRIAFSPDGRTIAVGYEPTKDWRFFSVHLWDVATGKETRLGEPDKVVAFPVFSPDGKLVATCGGEAIRLWDATTGKELRRCANTAFFWSPVAFSPDGKLFAAMDGPLVRFWEVASGRALPPQSPPGHEGMVNSVVFTPDGQTVIS